MWPICVPWWVQVLNGSGIFQRISFFDEHKQKRHCCRTGVKLGNITMSNCAG
jgi:hypothetical protein